jgi:hypothetical protein
MPPAEYEPTISAGERPLGPVFVFVVDLILISNKNRYERDEDGRKLS